MYTIKAYWAGYQLFHSVHQAEFDCSSRIEELEELFDSGIEHQVHGTSMKVKVLCVDVFEGEELVRQVDFKV